LRNSWCAPARQWNPGWVSVADDAEARPAAPSQGVVDAVLSASRALITVATKSLGAAAEEITIAQYRALVVLASHGPQRLGDLAGVMEIAPSTAGRMCDRLVGKGLIRRHRAQADRRVVQVSLTPLGRQVVDETTSRRRALISEILASLPPARHQEVAEALQAFADAARNIPDSRWPDREPGAPPAQGQGQKRLGATAERRS
jgi:DNA-binding MarR family transcriptional regulator